ncbi:MAG TPA: hypothetical protein PKA64_02320 [Myxococcota bacterium]|nr:hypothetical protein [Myxococcota bacterium]
MSRAALLLLVAGCPSSGGLGKGGDDTDTVAAATSFGADVLPILQVNCAISGCHAGPELSTGLDLTTGQAYHHIVDVPSFQLATMDLIEPGNPDASYLVRKVEGSAEAAGGSGDLMPPGFGLPQGDIDVIRQWVTEGALQN